jgi:hypothetical protein
MEHWKKVGFEELGVWGEYRDHGRFRWVSLAIS